VSPQTRHSHPWFPPSFQRSSIATRTRYTPFTRLSPQPPRLTDPASYSSYPASRPPYPDVYNPSASHLRPVLSQGHKSTDSFPAAHTAFVDDGEGMGPISVLHVHTAAYPDERERGLEVAMEDMRVDDAVVTPSPSQPQLTPPGVMKINCAEAIQRPASAPPIFPHSGLESDRHDAEEEAFVDDMNDLRDDRVKYVHIVVPSARLSRLRWRRLFPFACWPAGAGIMTLTLFASRHVHPLLLYTGGSRCPTLLWHGYGSRCGRACIRLSDSSLLAY
jgi:hypothetical protein